MTDSVGSVRFLLLVAAAAGEYLDCTPSVECVDRINGTTYGTEADLAAACDADPTCLAYDYDANIGYGFRCSTVSSHGKSGA